MSMEITIREFLDRMQVPTKKLGVKELREREEIWRTLWGWIDEEVKFYVLRVGQQARAVRRDYRGAVGELGQAKFELKELEIAVVEKTYNQVDGKYYFEQKIIKIPHGAMLYFEVISESTPEDEVNVPEVGSFSEEESQTAEIRG